MFENLVQPTATQIEEAVRALQREEGVAFLVDEVGVFVLVSPCPNREVDFVCVFRSKGRWLPCSMTQQEHNALQQWAAEVIPALCAKWHALDAVPEIEA